MHLQNSLSFIQNKIKQIIILTAATLLIAGGFLVSKSYAGGGDPCSDGVPDAILSVSPGDRYVGSEFNVSFDGSYSVSCDTQIASYEWDFGDGTTGSGESVSHQYGVGTYSPSLTVTDEAGLTDTRYYYNDIIVKADNQDPVFNDSSFTVPQGGEASYDVSVHASDPDGDDLSGSFSLPDGEYGSQYTDKGYVAIGYNGEVTYYAYSDAEGSDTFRVATEDGFGGLAYSEVTVNFDPRLAAADDYAETENNQPVTINVLDNDVSYTGQSFGIAWYEYAIEGGYVTNNGDGTITFTPDGNFTGTTSFEYQIETTDGEEYYLSSATIYVEVTEQNLAPVSSNDSISVDEDSSATIDVLANDSDPNGDELSVSISSGPSNGTAVVNADGTISYTPNANYYGSDSFTYTATDPQGLTSTATVSVSVNSINDGPTAVFTTSSGKGGKVIFDASGSSDIDGQIVSYSWDFGDGTTETTSSSTTEHRYKKKKNQPADPVVLTVTDDNGATATYTLAI